MRFGARAALGGGDTLVAGAGRGLGDRGGASKPATSAPESLRHWPGFR